MAVTPGSRYGHRMNPVPAPIYPGTRIPSPIPTMIQVPEELRREADILEVNFGPNHPSTHGVLRLVVQLDDLGAISADARVAREALAVELDAEAGTVRFGDGVRGRLRRSRTGRSRRRSDGSSV